MKHKQQFRQQLAHREALAMDPRALDIFYETANTKENHEQENGIHIVSICGPLEHHASWMFDSYDDILQRLEDALRCDTCRAVVMCIDSPGGDAAGATETHKQIQRLKKTYGKKVYAYSNEAMYSAAYSIGSAADEIWVPETGGVGSIGVICALLDKTKANEQAGLNIKLLTTGSRKADTHADRELTDDVVNAMQKRVDFLGDVFFRCVAKARNITPKEVRSLQAGVFMGAEAVTAGLADGVLGWFKFLEYVKDKVIGGGTDESKSAKEPSQMKTLAELKKLQAEAAKKLLACKNSNERVKLLSAYTAASTELSEFQAKTKYIKKTEERRTSDDETEEDEESEDEEESESEDDDGDDDEDDDTEESESEEEESDSKSKKSKATALSLKTVDRLYSLAAKVTGKADIREIFGALEGMSSRLANTSKLEQRVAKIEGSSRRTSVKSMLDKASQEGRVTPAQAKGLFDQGLKDPKWLKGYLSSQPKIARSLELPDVDGIPETVEAQSLTRDQQKMLEQAAQSAGMSVVDYTAQISKFNKKPGNIALPKT